MNPWTFELFSCYLLNSSDVIPISSEGGSYAFPTFCTTRRFGSLIAGHRMGRRSGTGLLGAGSLVVVPQGCSVQDVPDGTAMIGPVVRTDAAAGRVLAQLFVALPPKVRLALLVFALLFGLAACGVAWVDQQGYQPSPNICRADEIARPDCQRVVRVRPTSVPTPAGWER
ncbi:hypothetical protein ACW9HH_36470 [Nocardia gipuzkoensis]